jgi:hypothetical protein
MVKKKRKWKGKRNGRSEPEAEGEWGDKRRRGKGIRKRRRGKKRWKGEG